MKWGHKWGNKTARLQHTMTRQVLKIDGVGKGAM
jgi:hypothetical protein